ncbi:MAG TPA: ABC transporter ATP-binding protein [Anaerolineales bacterium]|nr:ABC transporter ATP-binding protein [Anaerolineales bacterium]
MHGGGWWALIGADETKGKAKVDRKLLSRILEYARPYWGNLSIVLVVIIVISFIELVPPLIFRRLIDVVIPSNDFRQLTILALAMIAIPILSGLIGIIERYFSAKAGEGIIFDLRQEMYDHIQRMSLRFFTNTRSGEIVSRFNSDVVGAQNAITGTLPSIITNSVTLISTLVVMISIDARLTLLSVAVLPLFLLPTRRVARILRDIRRKAMEYNADLSSLITETLGINGALLVKTFGRQYQESDRFRNINQNVRDIGVRRALVGRWFFMGLGISGAIGTALIYWAGGYLVMTDVLTIGTIVAFAAYLTRLYGPISSLTNVQVDFATSMVSFERVFEYLDLPIEIQDEPDARKFSNVDGRVSFENVSFSYTEKENLKEKISDSNFSHPADEDLNETSGFDISQRWALKDVTFDILPGELAALVGYSGAGKTTITYLLPRLYEATGGRITIDDIDISQVTQESLANQIGIVTQETYLFHDTIEANLCYADPSAEQDQLEAACRAANIHDFIQEMPDGYKTVVGERGYRLSGGEKQRLAIARVILKDPRILILDEATSHLDSYNESLIQAALTPLMSGRTSLVIAHRLSTILAADKILVLHQGRLIEQGNHSTLLANGGLYAELYETQFMSDVSEN